MEIIRNIAAVIGCISAGIALVTTVVKPVRKKIVNMIASKSQFEQMTKNIAEVNGKMDVLTAGNEDLKTRLTNVEKNVLENEADRLRSELFDCGNRCRRGIRLHPEEYNHILASFAKYSQVLKQNGLGESEMRFITNYYNHQKFPAYHSTDNT